VIRKVVADVQAALEQLADGMTVLIGGFGDVGFPFALVEGLVDRGTRDLTIVANNCGTGERGLARLFATGRVRRVIASFPSQPGNHHFLRAYETGTTELELTAQGTLAERLRAGAAGLGGFYTPTAVGTSLAGQKEVREVDGRQFILELPLKGDIALVRAQVADRFGNLRFRRSARNFNPVMAMAGDLTVVQVSEIVPAGSMDPDDIHTPGVFVDHIVVVR